MEIDKNKKQKNLERYFLAPNLRPFLGVTVTKETDIEDEFEIKGEDETKSLKVQQTIHGTEFVTEMIYEEKIDENNTKKEESKITYNLAEGTKLIWVEGQGYIATEEPFQTIDEIIQNYNYLKE